MFKSEQPGIFGTLLEKWRDWRQPLRDRDIISTQKENLYMPKLGRFSREAQDDLYTIGEGLATYAHDQDIQQMIYLDRNCRLAYIPVEEYWGSTYPNEPHPAFYFINPRGMLSIEKLAEEAAPEKTWERTYNLRQWASDDPMHENNFMRLKDIRSKADIQTELARAITKGKIDTSLATLIVDTCLHWGLSMSPVLDMLQDAGFTNLRVAVISAGVNTSNIKPDYAVFAGVAAGRCNPMGKESAISKTFSSIHSQASRKGDRDAYNLRREIRDIMKRQIAYRQNLPDRQ